MDTKAQLQALYRLQQLDSALAALQRQYNALDQGRAEKAALEAAQAAHKEADTTLHATSTALRDSELEEQTVETKAAAMEKKLYGGTVRAPKELQSLQEEIEMLKRQRGRLDEKILTLMDEVEAQRAREAETKQALAAAEAAFQAKRAAYKRDAEALVAQARIVAAQRAEAAKAVPPALLKRYESLRASKGGLAIAALEDENACGGCKMGLPSSQVKRIHEGNTIEVCENCGRLLCIPPPQE
ncbi:MAG TPA: C4-type zinc ribbon domain-containing protein [Chthonomonadaceae bacterium]|nr:C4-type zinc ribbon domain-containing protein [Chthonomonadaceae bacterium]